MEDSTWKSGEPKERAPQYAASRWLFSDELFSALQGKKPSELRHVENVVRAHLQMALLPAGPH